MINLFKYLGLSQQCFRVQAGLVLRDFFLHDFTVM